MAIKWKMKISAVNLYSVVFSTNKKESDNLNLKFYGKRIESQKEIKFLDIKFDSKLNFNLLVDQIKERCNTRLSLNKSLSSLQSISSSHYSKFSHLLNSIQITYYR
ncbi:hypothetical protein BpHYR1_033413 [Brachionus plicatilis]|uniref:RNA-directed DNA polymerase from mobile element jockey-like n=1 Tax=Brachionus plicatilis TaxID=10195 RepID=A0A3M7R8G8_BRAPC|nr:hypothetical protein BpHYR1_033413 [Brachionus plicatilis]